MITPPTSPETSPASARADLRAAAAPRQVRLLNSLLPSAAELAAGRRKLHAKALFTILLGVSSYVSLIHPASPVVLRLLAAVGLVHAFLATATGIFHDANHNAFARSRAANRIWSLSGEVIGASSFLWRKKHNDLHHRHTNVEGVDTDIEQQPFARLSPSQTWRPWHRAQHIYLWFLYGFLTLQWVLYGDVLSVLRGRIGSHKLAKHPGPLAVVKVLSGKALHVSWALVLPMFLHPVLTVLAVYAALSWVVGFVLSVTFQLAHCVDAARFASSEPDSGFKGDEFFRHQLDTTVDVEIANRPLAAYISWLVGGLDRQVEHHLAPKVPHTLYKSMASRLDELCATVSLRRRTHAGILAALRSHQRWLRAMGARPTT